MEEEEEEETPPRQAFDDALRAATSLRGAATEPTEATAGIERGSKTRVRAFEHGTEKHTRPVGECSGGVCVPKYYNTAVCASCDKKNLYG